MQTPEGRFEPTRFEELTITVGFRCHSACKFCIVREGMNDFRGVPLERFASLAADNARHRRYRRVVLTGGEVTLEPALFDYLAVARTGGFEHVRLQTNGRRLRDAQFARRLMEAGVDEFFVSLHGPDAATQDLVSEREGSFDEAWAGMCNLAAMGACLMTNTVMTSLNADRLADIVERVAPLRPVRMEFWYYLPMEDVEDRRDLLVPMAELAPRLRTALDRCVAHGIEAVVKYVPRCLLGEHGDRLDNAQPDVVIAEDFYEHYPKFSCLWEARCEHSEHCLGLHHPYVHKYGWEQDLLVPQPRTRPWRAPTWGPAAPVDRPGRRHLPVHPDERAEGHAPWRALVEGVAERHGARLAEVLLQRRACVFRFEIGDGGVDVVLTARSENGPALVRTASFDVHYRNPSGADREACIALVRDAARAIATRDPGGMRLEARKGLVGAEARRSAAR